MRVIGTAGHVDHGKSTLVQALTGIDPDRLKEEKEREMTIDLGFAWLQLPSGREASIVDVPGHEDFIKNMLAGVGGIDTALLVVAADEGPMPQTREHLAILDLLEISSGVVALNKIDLVDEPDWLDLVEAEVEEMLAPTHLAHAPIIQVSGRTGEGLEALRETLDRLLAEPTPRRDVGRPRLPIDRVFTVAGFGTVVTGTLIDGHLQVGDAVEIQPKGLKARIRGLQTHKQKIERAVPGSRVAANLSGVRVEELERGDVVTLPGWLRGTRLIDVQLRMLESAPRPLKHNVEVEVFTGAAQVMARTRIVGAYEIAPGSTGWAQLRLAEELAVSKGDRFIIRQPSPSLTIGGGVVVDPHPRRRHRRFQPTVLERLQTLASDTPADILLGTLMKQEPLEAQTLVRRSQLPAEEAAAALETLVRSGKLLVLSETPPAQLVTSNAYLLSRAGWTRLMERLQQMLAAYHQDYPLRLGMPREELPSRLNLALPVVNAILERAQQAGILMAEAGIVRLATHQVTFSPEQEQRIATVLSAFQESPYSPPSRSEVEAQVGAEILHALLEQGYLTQVSEDVLFLTETLTEMVGKIMAHIQETGEITVAQTRDMFGTSRKYALAVLEYLDDQRITRRVGDVRILVQPPTGRQGAPTSGA